MSDQSPRLLLTTSPFLKHPRDTAWIMWQVNLSLIPVVLTAVWFFGVGVLLVIAAATLGAVLPEHFLSRERSTIRDGSALITGVLLGLVVPPAIPLWMAFVGGAVAILLGKLLFGGVGYTVFNPALVGRAFLQAAFPESMTTWTAGTGPDGLFRFHEAAFAMPFMRPGVDAVSSATPLARMKFDGEITALPDLLLGGTAGSIGETAAVVILLCGVYLAVRRVINWRIPVSIFVSVGVFGGILYLVNPAIYPPPQFHLFAGGLILGAVYMATDPVTSPLTQRGCWIFGFGIGVLVVVIRQFGGLPEGVMYAILLMNSVVPLINRATQPRTFGTERADFWKPA